MVFSLTVIPSLLYVVQMPKLAKKSKRTAEAIYKHAVQFYKHRHWSEVTVQMLADDLGISRSTFYAYYDSPVNFVPRMLADFCWAQDQGPDAWFFLENDLPFHLVGTQKNLVNQYKKKGWVIRLGYEIAMRQPFPPWWQYRADCGKLYAANIERQQQLGVIRPEVNASDLGLQMFDINISTYLANYWPNGPTEPSAVLRQLAGVWLPVLYKKDLSDLPAVCGQINQI